MSAPPSIKVAQPGSTGRMQCPTCAFTWVRTAGNADKKECPKCLSKLPQTHLSSPVAGRSRPMGDKSPLAPSASSAMESSGGSCPQGGPHTYKFGMCSKCKASEGKLRAAPAASAGRVCSTGGKCIFKFAKCTKCGKSEL